MKKILVLLFFTSISGFAQIASVTYPPGSGASAQITSAIAAAIAAGGGDIFLPAGTYVLSSPITFTISCIAPPSQPLHIHGAGPGTIIQTSGTPAFEINGAIACSGGNLLFENMTILSTATAPYGLQVNGIAGFVFRNINLQGPSTIGVQFMAAQQGEWDGGSLQGAVTDFDFEPSGGTASNTIEVHGIAITAVANGTAFYVNQIDDLDIHSNSIVGDVAALPINGCTGLNQVAGGYGYITFHDNHVEGCKLGAYITQAIVSDNSFYPANTPGTTDIEINGLGNIVRGNLFQGAILNDATSIGTKFEANTLANTQPNYSFTDNGSLTQLFGNSCYTNGYCGLGTIFQDALTINSYSSTAADIATFNASITGGTARAQGVTINGAGAFQPIYLTFGVSSAIWGDTGSSVLNIGPSTLSTPWATVASGGINTVGLVNTGSTSTVGLTNTATEFINSPNSTDFTLFAEGGATFPSRLTYQNAQLGLWNATGGSPTDQGTLLAPESNGNIFKLYMGATANLFTPAIVSTGTAALTLNKNTSTLVTPYAVTAPSYTVTGTTFSATGCSISTLVGGPTAGSYTSGTSGSCTVVITTGMTAPNGYYCGAADLTTTTSAITQTASTTSTATLSGVTGSGDVIHFGCTPF